MINFEPTEYSRKLDTVGRLVIPSKLRKEMRLELGEEYPFYTCVDEHGQSWLCIPCPGVETEVDKAKRILEENGYRFFEEWVKQFTHFLAPGRSLKTWQSFL